MKHSLTVGIKKNWEMLQNCLIMSDANGAYNIALKGLKILEKTGILRRQIKQSG